MAAMASSATLMQSLTLSAVMRALRLDHSPASVKSLQPDSSSRTTPCICSSITCQGAGGQGMVGPAAHSVQPSTLTPAPSELLVGAGLPPTPSLDTAWVGCGHGWPLVLCLAVVQDRGPQWGPCRAQCRTTSCQISILGTGEQPPKRGCPHPLSPAHLPLAHPPPRSMATSNGFAFPARMGEDSIHRWRLQATVMNPRSQQHPHPPPRKAGQASALPAAQTTGRGSRCYLHPWDGHAACQLLACGW